MSDCIFCKLANGEIPTAKLYEDDDFSVILDANPATKGHALILPKAHYADIYEADGLNIVQNNGGKAGQTVFHFHIHLIPRYAGGLRIVADWVQNRLSDDIREEVIAKASVKEF